MNQSKKPRAVGSSVVSALVNTIAAGLSAVAVQYFLFGSVDKTVYAIGVLAGVGTYFYERRSAS